MTIFVFWLPCICLVSVVFHMIVIFINIWTVMVKTKYTAKKPDKSGFIYYTDAEHKVWEMLYKRQIVIIQNRACSTFIEGINLLALSATEVPQCVDVSKRLKSLTGWSVTPVEALISFEEFFTLLSNKQFPAASFIRTPEELDYLQEPDIFHEIFGHCPMLTNQAFADFTHRIGKLGLTLDKKDRSYLARLYWFTAEFGLIATSQGLRVYGGGILSSKNETEYALTSDIPLRLPLDLPTVLRTPYRYDQVQLSYFVINRFEDLYGITESDIIDAINQAKLHGMLPSRYTEEIMDQRSC